MRIPTSPYRYLEIERSQGPEAHPGDSSLRVVAVISARNLLEQRGLG